MEIEETNLKDCYILTPKRFGDERGYFSSVTKKQLEDLGFKGIHQISNSMSGKGIVRGLHFQKDPLCQSKLVECLRGGVLDVVVDMRKDSPTYGQWYGVHLSAENKKQFFIPKNFAHGFIVLSDYAEFAYKCTDFYHPNDEGGLLWKDEAIGVEWPMPEGMTEADLIISDKDQKWGGLNG